MYQMADFSEITRERIALTKHAKIRLSEREITMDDILYAVRNGEIIRQYEDDTPLPSCLVLGYDLKKKPVHMVLSKDDNFIYLITAYRPDASEWDESFKIKTGGQK